MSVTAGDTPVPSPGTRVCRALLLGLDGEQKGVWLCFYPPKCDGCSCGSSRAPIRAVSFKAGKETVPFAVPFAVPWHPRRCCATLRSARPCPVRGEILSAPSCHPIHTSLSLLKEHPAPTGLNTDPDLPSQLCLSPFCSLQLGALSALPPLPILPNLALPPKPFSLVCFVPSERHGAPVSSAQIVFPLHIVWRALKEERENHSSLLISDHTFSLSPSTHPELGTKHPEVAASQRA